MARTRNTDLIVKMVDFTKPGVGTNKFMEEDSFIENVINSDYTNRRIENGMLKCLFTHQGRDYADADRSDTPYDDLLATHPDLCGVIRDVWVENHIAYAAIDLLDLVAFPAAGKVRDLIKKGTYVGVSMATDSVENSKGNFTIKELIGCDFTLDNYFIGSGIVTIKKNFSQGKVRGYLNFSNPKIRNENVIVEDNTTNFSLRDILIEAKKPYYQILQIRIRQTINVLKTLSESDIVINRKYILAYVNDMIYNWLSAALEGDGRVNINLGLRLGNFLKNRTALNEFNTKINVIKNMYKTQGFMTKQVQERLNTIMSSLMDNLWSYIMEKAGKDKVLLVGTSTRDAAVDNVRR